MNTIYFDGTCVPNPGECSYGISLQLDGKELDSFSCAIGKGTNNIAEYHGVISAMQMASAHNLKQCKIIGDSLLVINQINGNWKVKDPKLKILYDVAKNIQAFSKTQFSFFHVKRQYNKRADELSRLPLIEKGLIPTSVDIKN